MQTLKELNVKERTAIELRYLGTSTKEIAVRIDTPLGTVEGWFTDSKDSGKGKLFALYREFAEDMNKKRQLEIENKISISDDEMITLTTNLIRMSAMRMQPKQVLLVDKKGNAIADKDGKPQYITVPPDPDKFDGGELKSAWQIQRLTRGLPTSYEKQDIEQTSFETDVVMKALGLTDEDFSDENIESTRKRISDYLRENS